MYPTPASRATALLAALILVSAWSGCATAEQAQAPGIVVDGEKYVKVEPPVGSHMKRRVKVSEVNQVGISPTSKNAVTSESDMNVLPVTSGVAEQTRATGGR